MRLVNDRQPKTEPTDHGFFTIAMFASLSAFSIASVVFGPLPMILAHARLQDPWAKATAVLGALVALTLLEIPLPVVLFVFILGLFIADRVTSGGGFWAALRGTTLLAAGLGLVALALVAQTKKLPFEAAWASQVDALLAQVKVTLQPGAEMKWDSIRQVLIFEGPFLYLSGIIVSFWLSIGLAAHLGWLPEGHAFSGGALRDLRLPSWSGILFVGFFSAAVLTTGTERHLFSGLFRLFGCLLFIQGCVTMSSLMAARGWSQRSRTVAYAVGVLIGFYALVGLGAVSPWWSKKVERLEEVT